MSKKKKWILAILIPALLVGAVFGTYQILRANRDPVKVYPVKDLVEEGYYDYENYLSGTVKAERLQSFYPSTTQEITEVVSGAKALKRAKMVKAQKQKEMAIQGQDAKIIDETRRLC